MAELKTKKTQASVDAFIESIPDESRRDDCRAVLQLMKQVTRAKPKRWGTNVVGFGDVHTTVLRQLIEASVTATKKGRYA